MREPSPDPCTFCITLATGNHYIPIMCRRSGNNVEILAYNSMAETSDYNEYINIAEAAMVAAIEKKGGLQAKVLPTQHIPQKGPANGAPDGVSCGPYVALAMLLVDETKTLEEQAGFIGGRLQDAMSTPEKKAALRQLELGVLEGNNAQVEKLNGMRAQALPGSKKKVETKEEPKGKKENSVAKKENKSIDLSEKKGAPLIPPLKGSASSRDWALPPGAELKEVSKYLWDLAPAIDDGKDTKAALRNDFIIECNLELEGEGLSTIKKLEFAENAGEHKVTVTTQKEKEEAKQHDIYMTPTGMATEALIPEVYTVMAVAAKRSLKENDTNLGFNVSPTGSYPTPEAKNQVLFELGKALVNEGLVPQFPEGTSLQEFADTLNPAQKEQLRASVDKMAPPGSKSVPQYCRDLQAILPAPQPAIELRFNP
ncbi:MAG: hypothetical protein HKM04_02015 [Legionellales bacterium]|nr:hypothetical protein [Legionellales bacterium]